MNRPLLALSALIIVLLSACRLDVDVAVEMQPDGTGSVTVTAVADAELMAQVPDLVDDLRLDDAIANGWVVEGPTLESDGGATITLTHPFASDTELANVLNSIGPPLNNVGIARTVGVDQTTNAIDATLGLPDGLASFADSDLVTAVGGVPFSLDTAASPSEVMSFDLRVDLPGELQRAETGNDVGDGVIEWRAALDGTSTQVRLETVQRIDDGGNSWAGPVSKVAFVLFVAWCVVAVAFIAFVAIARRRRGKRRRQVLRQLDQR